MAKMKKCPQCGSENITINGVPQRKKGLWYYLSGQAAANAGERAGYKAVAKLKGLDTNAECSACGYKWREK